MNTYAGFGTSWLALALLACGPVVAPETGSSSSGASTTVDTTTTAAATTSTGETPTTSGEPGTSTDPVASTGDSSSSSTSLGDFIITPDGGGGCGAVAPTPDGKFRCTTCDVFQQDCGDGEKCVAAPNGNGGWNTTTCVEVTGSGVAGDLCTAGDHGADNCAFGHMCWDLDDALHGTCVALCTGSEEEPVCAGDSGCLIGNEGVLNLCLPRCDPLVQDCPGDDLCLPSGQEFLCVLDGSGEAGAVNGPCSFVNSCDKGLLCLAVTSSAACMQDAGGCCQPFCTFPGGACPNVDQSCQQFFDPEMGIPPGHEDVGICSTPP